MNGHWKDKDNGDIYEPTESDITTMVEDWIDDDGNEFEQWARDECDDDIMDTFFWNQGYRMEDKYEEIKNQFIRKKVSEILEEYRGQDIYLSDSHEFIWENEHDVRRVQIQAIGVVYYDADETTLEDYLKHNYPFLKDFSVVTRELPKEE